MTPPFMLLSGVAFGRGDSWLEGINGTGPSSGFAWHRETLRISDTPRTFSMHIATVRNFD